MRRAVQLLAGLVLYAASIAMLVHASLGNMPWDVLSQGLGRRLGWSLGTATIVVSVAVLACWIPLRQRPGVGTVANVLVIGLLVDPFLRLLGLLPELGLVARVALTAGGVLLNAVATACYIGTRLGPGPRDGLMTGLVARTGWSVRTVRTSIEVLVVLVGWVLGGTVGLGTLAYALAIGPLVHVLLPRFTVPSGARLAPTRAPREGVADDDGADRTQDQVADDAVVQGRPRR
nr:hypothetical protein [Cellulomonas sp. APG4]